MVRLQLPPRGPALAKAASPPDRRRLLLEPAPAAPPSQVAPCEALPIPIPPPGDSERTTYHASAAAYRLLFGMLPFSSGTQEWPDCIHSMAEQKWQLSSRQPRRRCWARSCCPVPGGSTRSSGVKYSVECLNYIPLLISMNYFV
jgi:hypothetical protein